MCSWTAGKHGCRQQRANSCRHCACKQQFRTCMPADRQQQAAISNGGQQQAANKHSPSLYLHRQACRRYARSQPTTEQVDCNWAEASSRQASLGLHGRAGAHSNHSDGGRLGAKLIHLQPQKKQKSCWAAGSRAHVSSGRAALPTITAVTAAASVPNSSTCRSEGRGGQVLQGRHAAAGRTHGMALTEQKGCAACPPAAAARPAVALCCMISRVAITAVHKCHG